MANSTNSPWPLEYENPPKFVPFWFENVDTFRWKEIMLRNPNFAWYTCAVYLTTVFSLQFYMKDRPVADVKKVMVGWNAFLAIFSAFGFYRVAQELLFNLSQTDGYYRTVCESGASSSLQISFRAVKFGYLEFGKSRFRILRNPDFIQKRQYYHHCIVTLFAWKLHPWGEPILSHYCAINFGVHAVMYAYFVARRLNIRVPEALAMAIMTLQIAQMIINTGNNFYTMAMLSRVASPKVIREVQQGCQNNLGISDGNLGYKLKISKLSLHDIKPTKLGVNSYKATPALKYNQCQQKSAKPNPRQIAEKRVKQNMPVILVIDDETKWSIDPDEVSGWKYYSSLDSLGDVSKPFVTTATMTSERYLNDCVKKILIHFINNRKEYAPYVPRARTIERFWPLSKREYSRRTKSPKSLVRFPHIRAHTSRVAARKSGKALLGTARQQIRQI
ncbi:putative fatty acid elongation protein 3 [Folsomia candida]|uniref:Elongation of very long chain fatty acids protein n=1 Tax=Folsomia candida TaxID=158441 RepID=A0A226DN00_FOLCA|nr:putative fatty acid elongation protein 3 [Folsomia candida]